MSHLHGGVSVIIMISTGYFWLVVGCFAVSAVLCLLLAVKLDDPLGRILSEGEIRDVELCEHVEDLDRAG